ATQSHEPEVPHAVVIERVMLFDDLMHEHSKGRAHEVHEPMMLDRYMRRRSRWSFELAERTVFDELATTMQVEHWLYPQRSREQLYCTLQPSYERLPLIEFFSHGRC